MVLELVVIFVPATYSELPVANEISPMPKSPFFSAKQPTPPAAMLQPVNDLKPAPMFLSGTLNRRSVDVEKWSST